LFIQRVDANWCHAEIDGICHCHNCDYDLRLAEAPVIDDRGSGLFPELQQLTRELSVLNTVRQRDLLERLHAIAVTVLSCKVKPRLCNCLACSFGYSDLEIEQPRKPALELQPVLTRHAVLLWSLWLLQHDTEAQGVPVKPIAPLHHQFVKDILNQYRRDAGSPARLDSPVGAPADGRASSSKVRDGRVVELH
jgi:hypothetical protein